jgi:serine protease
MLKIIISAITIITLTSCGNPTHTPAPNENPTNTIIVTLREPALNTLTATSLNDTVTNVIQDALRASGETQLHSGTPEVLEVIHGFIMHNTSNNLMNAILSDNRVNTAEWDSVTTAFRGGVTWGLDRIDQRSPQLDQRFLAHLTGANVRVYVVDSGIHSSHSEFGGRVTVGYSAILDGRGTEDCSGHGTHVAGTIGSRTFGVAPGVSLTPVRVLNCNGSGTVSNAIKGLNWVLSNAQTHDSRSIVNVSLGAGGSSAFDSAVRTLYGNGIVTVVAAGNQNRNACNYSPGREPTAITVASISVGDVRSAFSNFGSCVDLFAPGEGIRSTDRYDSGTAIQSGTSMAAPHVTGIAALHLEDNPNWSAAQLSQLITLSATPNVITSPGVNSPNRLAYVNPNLGRPTGTTPTPTQPETTCDCTKHTFILRTTPTTAFTPPVGLPFGTLTTTVLNPERKTITVNLERLDDNVWVNVRSLTVTEESESFSLNNFSATHRYRIHTTTPTTVTIEQRHVINASIRTSGTSYTSGAFFVPERVLNAALVGPNGTNYDLFLERRDDLVWRVVASSQQAGSSEALTFRASEGLYRWRVQSRVGVGTFSLRSWSN